MENVNNNIMKSYKTISPNQTKLLAKKFTEKIKGGEVLGLIGDLGSGKTVFVQGLAKALGVKKIVNSPTFVLMKIYEIRESHIMYRVSRPTIHELVHIDAYRINNYHDLLDIGLDEYLNREDTLVIIEWADKVPEIKKTPGYVEIKFTLGKSKNTRVIKMENNL